MRITSISVGDSFVHENGDKVVVTNISCAYDESESRWETSIMYDVVRKSLRVDDTGVDKKARDFVIMIQKADSGFVAQLSATPEQPIDEISFTTGTAAAANRFSSPVTDNKLRQAEEYFAQHAHKYGLQPDDFGCHIRLHGAKKKKYKIIGLRKGDRKTPIRIQGPRGGVYRITAQMAIDGLK